MASAVGRRVFTSGGPRKFRRTKTKYQHYQRAYIIRNERRRWVVLVCVSVCVRDEYTEGEVVEGER